jgi:hypothetical protein
MIQIFINPTRVESVVFAADSDIEQDFDFAAWQAIRPLVDQIDQRLARIVKIVNHPESETETETCR